MRHFAGARFLVTDCRASDHLFRDDVDDLAEHCRPCRVATITGVRCATHAGKACLLQAGLQRLLTESTLLSGLYLFVKLLLSFCFEVF